MFGILRKKLKESVKQLAAMASGEPSEKAAGPARAKPPKAGEAKHAGRKKDEAAAPERKPVPPEERKAAAREEKKGGLSGLFRKIREKEFSEQEIDEFVSGIEAGLLQANVAMEVIDFMKAGLKKELAGRPVSRSGAEKVITEAFRRLIFETVDQKAVDLEDVIRKAGGAGRPACILFLGFNGSGKTTTIAKVAKLLMKGRHRPVLAAADTFRAASIEQLEFHGNRLGIGVIKQKYGADPAAVVFDARKHAESAGLDVVLVDTAGRMHTNVNLMDELKKISRVNSPDLKLLIVDSLTGNDVVEQVRKFDGGVGIDGLILTKMDVNEKGGSVMSACYVSKKPVLYIGTGQGYDDIEEFDPKKFVSRLLD